jgi:hypoxanthine phosphoribosyltransferase
MKILFNSVAIMERTKELAGNIMIDYHNRGLVVISVLNGAFMFTADLVRQMRKPDLTMYFVRASSYKGVVSLGKVEIDRLPLVEIAGKNVLVVEDIVDTGRTCTTLRERLMIASPLSLKFCALLDKPSCREVDFKPDYTGFIIPNWFVVGYGLDYDEKYRHLPNIYTFEKGRDNVRLTA